MAIENIVGWRLPTVGPRGITVMDMSFASEVNLRAFSGAPLETADQLGEVWGVPEIRPSALEFRDMRLPQEGKPGIETIAAILGVCVQRLMSPGDLRGYAPLRLSWQRSYAPQLPPGVLAWLVQDLKMESKQLYEAGNPRAVLTLASPTIRERLEQLMPESLDIQDFTK